VAQHADQARFTVVKAIAACQKPWSSVSPKSFGSLYYATYLGRSASMGTLCIDANGCRVFEEKYAVGLSTARDRTDNGTATVNVDRGVSKTSQRLTCLSFQATSLGESWAPACLERISRQRKPCVSYRPHYTSIKPSLPNLLGYSLQPYKNHSDHCPNVPKGNTPPLPSHSFAPPPLISSSIPISLVIKIAVSLKLPTRCL
jgi:hypothetical protein